MKEIILIATLFANSSAIIQSETGIISGRLLFADGAPVVSATVEAVPVPPDGQPLPNTVQRRARTDESGLYRIQNIPAGRYFVRTNTDGMSTFHPGVAAPDDASVIAIGAGSTAIDVDFALPPSVVGFTVSGRVIPPPNPPQDAEAQNVVISGGRPLQVFRRPVSEDGTFEFQGIRAGSYSITVTPAPGMQPVPLTVSASVDGIELNTPPGDHGKRAGLNR